MRDPVAGRHEVGLTEPDHTHHTAAIAVLDLALEQPRQGLLPGVRMRRHVYAVMSAGTDRRRAVVIDKAPGAHQGPMPLRQGPPYRQCTKATERHVSGGDDFHPNHRAILVRELRHRT